MTSVMQMVKSPDTLQEWKTIFPDFTTLTGSSLFIKKLMAVSLSAITYIRGVFPERGYGERNLCGLRLKLLTEDSGIDAVNKFISLIRSCYEAIDRKYLHQLTIGICTDVSKRNEVVESFNLNFRYRDDEFSVTCNNKTSATVLSESDPTVSATVLLLKSIMTMTDILEPLPKNAYLTMKLLYNDITPPDYEPPGFEPSENDKFKFSANAVKLELGKVATNMHGYKMYLKTAMGREPLSHFLEESLLIDSQKSAEAQAPEDFPICESAMQSNLEINEKDSMALIPDENEVDCPCKCRQNLDIETVQCKICERKQHSICYGILESKDKPSEFYCVQCITEAPLNSPLDLIHSHDGEDQKELCALRRALVYCSTLKHVTLLQLEKKLGCATQLAKDLLERLEFEEFIKKAGNKKYIVNEKRVINIGYKTYFPKKEKDEIRSSQKTKQSKNLNTNNSLENQPPRKSTRRSLMQMEATEDSPEMYRPRKKRCVSTKEAINLNKWGAKH